MSHPLSDYYKEERPWGSFERFIHNEPCSVKFLHVDAGKRFSLQTHAKREEFWRVIEGSGTFEIQGEVRKVTKGDEALIKVGDTHRLTGGADGITVLEIAFGEFDENDITRLEDDFGRP
jgi:mannose-6-phosphate isomerase